MMEHLTHFRTLLPWVFKLPFLISFSSYRTNCIWFTRYAGLWLPTNVHTLNTRTTHGKTNLIDVIKATDLEIGRSSWIARAYPTHHMHPWNWTTFPSCGQIRGRWNRRVGEIQGEVSACSCWLGRWRQRAPSQGMWWPIEVGNSPQLISSKKMGTSSHRCKEPISTNPNQEEMYSFLEPPERNAAWRHLDFSPGTPVSDTSPTEL